MLHTWILSGERWERKEYYFVVYNSIIFIWTNMQFVQFVVKLFYALLYHYVNLYFDLITLGYQITFWQMKCFNQVSWINEDILHHIKRITLSLFIKNECKSNIHEMINNIYVLFKLHLRIFSKIKILEVKIQNEYLIWHKMMKSSSKYFPNFYILCHLSVASLVQVHALSNAIMISDKRCFATH